MEREAFDTLARALGLGAEDAAALWAAAARESERSTARFSEHHSETWDPGTPGGLSTEERAGLAVVGRPDRYSDIGPLGAGAVGEVRRVRDMDLNRVVAMKTLRKDRRNRPRAVARFLSEAQATAQLQHPGIVPVHEMGMFEDGRLYYTMREVRGRTLREALRGAQAQGLAGLRRAVGLVKQAADAVGYAHSRGVVHRDLKPDNILVGEHGEVLVVDWGLARVGHEGVEDEVQVRGSLETRHGTVAGTPAYMAPEQARGQLDRIAPWTDVWALGAIVYEVLTGRPPYVGRTGDAVVEAIRAGPPPAIAVYTSAAPPELAGLVERALAREPEGRFADGRALAEELQRWLDGALQRERALEEVARAATARGRQAELGVQALALREAADAALAGLPAWAPEGDKQAGWALLDEADAADHEARLALDRADRALQAALTHAPGLPEAHEALADRAREAWVRAERAGDAAGQVVALGRLEEHVQALPAGHAARERHGPFLTGTGALSLHTDPTGARVRLFRFAQRNRRLIPEEVREVGVTPLDGVPVEPGSWLLRIEADGRAPVDYPVFVRRGEHWDGIPPGESTPRVIALPTPEELGDGCYVPAGWFRSGGDPLADSALPARDLWCEGLIVERFCVRVDAYRDFLDGVAASDGVDAAEAHYPRERGSGLQGGEPLVAWRDGRHVGIPDPEGEISHDDWPQSMLDMDSSLAYARWRREQDGVGWRLPSEQELQKARRGVDGRIWPWGNAFDPSWACVRDSHHDGRPMPVAVTAFAVDCSVYGVRGVGGNVLQRTASQHGANGDVDGQRVVHPDPETQVADPGTTYTVLGGLFHGTSKHSRCAARYGVEPTGRMSNVGLRLVRLWPTAAPWVP